MLFQAEKFFEKDERRALIKQIGRKIFLEDWTMKLIALVITLALWLGVSGLRAPKTERLRNVALNLRVSNDIEITDLPYKELDLIITGDDRKISQINKDDLLVSLDLTETPAGNQTLRLTPENIIVELPTGIKVVEIQPNIIPFKLERVEEREIPVKIETEGSPTEGFEIYGETAVPQKVRVRAPESYVKSLDFIATERISVKDKDADFTAKQVSLNALNPKIKLLDTVVDVSFRIGEKRIEKTFSVVHKTDTGESRVPVKLYGPRSIIEGLQTADIRLEIVKNEAGEQVLNVILPFDVQDKIEIRDEKILKK